MSFFSISIKRLERVGEPKTTFNVGTLPPTTGRAVELRVDRTAYRSQLQFWSDLTRLLQRTLELGEPRPEFVAPGVGEPWSDGTFWTDGTGWTE